eukprot:CAMPEP_0181183928 /NCGR_PEP_ID=MMETSP1096-20121128/8693_1 /TAXON_ID=156174 ORGANISM="Chrysochromulina ericina, Strain CCMP281" /NCGR_SAMPLE_ID=MMETSP1096 /ASSEMBLY_ACC=CAM_ASM_000453 /LENGTH=80 /DNA_ID=CAMNT_0023272653 /DNA_START=762 /DNA_END=1005 /DNA_ORIENTATION=-
MDTVPRVEQLHAHGAAQLVGMAQELQCVKVSSLCCMHELSKVFEALRTRPSANSTSVLLMGLEGGRVANVDEGAGPSGKV